MLNEISGILVIDKPKDITSAKVVACVKRLLGAKKVGHAGTLDPFATGVLVCCLNRATKLSQFFLHGDKKYEAVLCLGIETDTQDLTGIITSRFDTQNLELDKSVIQSVFKKFEGEIEQVPPVYSALKHNGVPLYKLARKGTPVQKPARTVFISSLKILDINLPEIRFEVSCSGGTYIRTLCADIGALLRCGGHLKELRRIESSGFTLKEAIPLSEVEKRISDVDCSSFNKFQESGKIGIIRMANALRKMPGYVADDALLQKIRHGKPITKKDIIIQEIEKRPEGFIKVVDTLNNLYAVLSYKKESNIYQYCSVFGT